MNYYIQKNRNLLLTVLSAIFFALFLALIYWLSLPISLLSIFILPIILSSLLFSKRIYSLFILAFIAGILWISSELSDNYEMVRTSLIFLTFALVLISEILYRLQKHKKIAELQLVETEEKLRVEKERAQQYLDVAGTIIVVVDKSLNVKLLNKKGRRILGYSQKEIQDKNLIDLIVAEEEKENIRSLLQKIMDGLMQPSIDYELLVVTKSGQKKIIHWNNSLLYDENKNIVGGIGVGTDVTMERKALDKLLESEQTLTEMNSAKDKFFSIISHDLRAPFTSLLGFIQLALDDFETLSKDELKKYLESIQKVSKNVFTLIQELLQWSYIHSGKIEVKNEQVDLYVSAGEVINFNNYQAGKKSVTLENNIPKETIIRTDNNIVLTILRNLVSNAVKFSNKDGVIKISSRRENDNLIVSVSDNGIGMKEEDQQKLFKIDEHISTNGTNGEQGTGLGLILCKDLVEKINGDIWVESELNKGSIFSFSIGDQG